MSARVETPVYIVRNYVRAKDVLTNVHTYLGAKDNRDVVLNGFRPLALHYDDKTCTLRSDDRDRQFEFEKLAREIDKHGQVYAGVLDSELNATGDESLDELRLLASKDGNTFVTLEPGRVVFPEGEDDVRSIMIMAGFKIPGLPVYCFDFNSDFLHIRANRASKTVLATESWRDSVFRPQFKTGIEATVGSYAVFYRGDKVGIQLYAPSFAPIANALDAKLRIETDLPHRLENGVLTLDAAKSGKRSFVRFGLAGDPYQNDEPLSYEYTLYRLGE